MASPQRENGYTAISNEIIEALSRIRINGEAWQVLNTILRKTYGFNKKQDKISLSQFVLSTSLTKQSVCRGLKRLINMNIIIKIDNEDIQIYRFNKDFDTWKSLSKLLKGVAVSPTTFNEIDNEPLAELRHTKEIDTKETITKEKLSNDSVPFKTLKEYRNLRRVQSGRLPMAKKVVTEKQKAFLKRMKSLDYFHKVGVEKEFDYLKEEDESANRKFQGIARTFEKRYGDNYKEVIDWWFSSDNAWCDYHPSNFYSVGTWMKFDNKIKNSKKGGGYYEI